MQFGAWEDVSTGLLYSPGKILLSNAAPLLSYAAPLLSYATPVQYVFTGTYGNHLGPRVLFPISD
jgi:hypothetical protein